LNFVGFKA